MTLGRIVHTITGRFGESDTPEIGNWQANEEVGFGYLGASGIVTEALVRSKPNVFTDGAEWRSYLAESGDVVWAGELTTPTIEGGVAHLVGKGWGEILPEREIENVLYETWDMDVWQYLDVTGRSDNLHWHVDNRGATLRFERFEKTGSRQVQDVEAFCFFPGIELHRMRADMVTGPSGTSTAEVAIWAGQGNDDFKVFPVTTVTGESTTVLDINLTRDDLSTPQAAPNYLQINLGDLTTNFTLGYFVEFHGIRLSGLPGGADLTDGGLVRDVADRIGVVAVIDDKAVSVLPFFPGAATAGELLDRAMLLSGYRARFLDHGQHPVLEYGPWGDRRWTIVDTRQPIVVHELDAYDRVSVTTTDGQRHQTQTALKLVPSPLVHRRTYGPVELPDKLVSAIDISRGLGGDRTGWYTHDAFAENLLQIVSRRRYAGDAQLAQVHNEDAIAVSAHLIHAGDVALHPTTSASLRIRSLRRTDAGVFVTFGNEVEAVLERAFARERHRIRVRR